MAYCNWCICELKKHRSLEGRMIKQAAFIHDQTVLVHEETSDKKITQSRFSIVALRRAIVTSKVLIKMAAKNGSNKKPVDPVAKNLWLVS